MQRAGFMAAMRQGMSAQCCAQSGDRASSDAVAHDSVTSVQIAEHAEHNLNLNMELKNVKYNLCFFEFEL